MQDDNIPISSLPLPRWERITVRVNASHLKDIQTNLESVRRRIDQACRRSGRSVADITLVAVTKTETEDVIQTAFELGIRNFGESRVQEASSKIRFLSGLDPQPAWHMIGHLQSNKLKTALEIFDIIHSVDSLYLAEAINRYAARRVPILLQVNVAGETTKSGFPLTGIFQAFKEISDLPQLEIKGLMTIAPIVKDSEEVRPVFRKLRELRDHFHLEHLSMGMTDDFEIAIEEGATLVRIGRAIFGERESRLFVTKAG
jgi:PLP dependent protein